MKPSKGRSFGFTNFALSDYGITPIPASEIGAPCTQCDARVAQFEVASAGDGAGRRLCHTCMLHLLEQKQPSLAEIAERTARELSEAEARLTPEQLGSWVEMLDSWWAGVGEPMPPALAEIVARHRASVPPPSTPASAGASAEDARVARLALVIMRGALCQQSRVDSERCIVDPSLSAISYEEAADSIARMAKPLDCRARAVDGVMAVRCRTIVSPSYIKMRETSERHMDELAAQHWDLRKRLGDGYREAKAYWLGCEESFLFTVGEMEKCQREYDLQPKGFGGGNPPGDYLVTSPEAARAAVASGADCMFQCYHNSSDRDAENEGRAIAVRGVRSPSVTAVYWLTPDLSGPCEQCSARPARWLATNPETTPWTERRLCDQCTATELAPIAVEQARELQRWVENMSEKSRDSLAEEISGAVERLGRWWKHLAAPPEVAAVLDRYRNR